MKFNLLRTLNQTSLAACGLDTPPAAGDLKKMINRQRPLLAVVTHGRLHVRKENKSQELELVFDIPQDSDLQKVCQWFMEEIK